MFFGCQRVDAELRHKDVKGLFKVPNEANNVLVRPERGVLGCYTLFGPFPPCFGVGQSVLRM